MELENEKKYKGTLDIRLMFFVFFFLGQYSHTHSNPLDPISKIFKCLTAAKYQILSDPTTTTRHQ